MIFISSILIDSLFVLVLAGTMKYKSEDCRVANGRKIIVTGQIVSQRKGKAGKVQVIHLRAGTVVAAAEFCGAMKQLELDIHEVNEERLGRFMERTNAQAELFKPDGEEEEEEAYHVTSGGEGVKLEESEEEEGEEEEEEEEEESSTRSRSRSNSYDSLASIGSIEEELMF